MPAVTPARASQLLQQHAPVLVVDTSMTMTASDSWRGA